MWIDEIYEGTMRFGLKGKSTLFSEKSPFQEVTIVETESMGRALLLDGMWMTAEGDDASYHEMLVHPAMATAKSARRVLIIGGGDGGTAREVLRYDEVERVDMVEIDAMVVEASRTYLSKIGTSWSDPRLRVTIDDGVKFVSDCDAASYDVILVDGSDPVGPAEVLFGKPFLGDCSRALTDGGVFVAQAGSPIVQRSVHLDLISVMSAVFETVAPYYGTVSIYPGGAWSWAWASNAAIDPADPNLTRIAAIEEDCHLYNRDVHRGAFCVPNHIRKSLR